MRREIIQARVDFRSIVSLHFLQVSRCVDVLIPSFHGILSFGEPGIIHVLVIQGLSISKFLKAFVINC